MQLGKAVPERQPQVSRGRCFQRSSDSILRFLTSDLDDRVTRSSYIYRDLSPLIFVAVVALVAVVILVGIYIVYNAYNINNSYNDS